MTANTVQHKAQISPSTSIILREYGKNIQLLVQKIAQIPDKEKRAQHVQSVLTLMKSVNPSLQYKNTPPEKVWNDLFMLSDYDLVSETPYPQTAKKPAATAPQKVAYTKRIPHFRQYGANIIALLEDIKQCKEATRKEAFLLDIAKWMASFHRRGNRAEDIVLFLSKVLGKHMVTDTAALQQKIKALPTETKNNKHYHHKRKFVRRKRRPDRS